MEIFKHKGKEYKFPITLSEVKLYQWQNLLTILDSPLDDMKKIIKAISAVSEIPENEILTLEQEDFDMLCSFLNQLTTAKPTDIEDHTFELSDGTILHRMMDLDKMTVAEYIDLDTILRDSENMWENAHVSMAVLWRPLDGKKIKKYVPAEALERSKILKQEMDVDNVYSSIVFFSLGKVESYLHMLDYLREVEMKKLEKEIQKMERHMKRGGDGKSSWIRYLAGLLSKKKDGIR